MNSGPVSRVSCCVLLLVSASTGWLSGCGGGGASGSGSGTSGPYALSVTLSGAGTVTSAPAGISCGSTCTASFAAGTKVTLSASAGNGYQFTGWSGACTGASVNRRATAAATTPAPASDQPLRTYQKEPLISVARFCL